MTSASHLIMSEHIFYPALNFSPLRIPGLKFWFNADSVAGASAAVWNDETGTHKATALTVTPRDFDTTYSTKKGAVFHNDNGSLRVTKLNGDPVYTSLSAYPSMAWAAVLASVDGGSGILLNRSIFTSLSTAAGFDRFIDIGVNGSNASGWSRVVMNSAGGGSWLEQQANVISEGSLVDLNPNNQLTLIVFQSVVDSEAGYSRFNGTPYNYRYSVPGIRDYTVGGSTLYGYFGIGAAPALINTTIRGNVRQVLYGEGKLSPATLLKLEGYLAHDGDIESLLPLDHPYRNNPPE